MSHEQKNAASDLLYLDVFDVVRRKFPLIVLGCVAGVALAALFCFFAKVKYSSDAVVLVISKDARAATSSGTADLGVKSNVGQELLATHMQILTSPKIIRKALMLPQSKANWQQSTTPETGDQLTMNVSVEADADSAQPLLNLTSLQAEIPMELRGSDVLQRKGAIAYLKDNLSVSRGGEGASKDAQVLRIRLQHTDAHDCQILLAALIDSYQDFLDASVKDTGNEAGELIRRASATLADQLAEQDAEYRSFLQDAPMLWNNDGETLNPHQMQVAKLEAELADVKLRHSEVKSRLALTKAVMEDELDDPLQRLTIFDGADVQRLGLLIQLDSESFNRSQPERTSMASVEFDRLLALNMEAQSDALRMGKNHPKYQQTQRQIEELKGFLAQRGGAGGQADGTSQTVDLERLVSLYHRLLKHDLIHLENRRHELASLIEEGKAASKEMITYELDESSLRRKLERTQSLYEAVVDRLRDIALVTDYGGYTTELISPPNEGIKTWPKIPMLMALGLLLGGMGGTTLAVGAELADRSFRDHKDIEQELGCDVLTHLPMLRGSDLQGAKGPVQPIVLSLHQPKSRHAEAVRSLRTSLFFKTKGDGTPVVQVTSPNAGDGKSTATANLAVSIAQTNKRVLLVDCDLRRPTQHKIFNLDADRGMACVLAGQSPIVDVVQESGVANLDVITSGPIPENPAELLALPEFAHFLSTVRSDYDYVLIDSPPVGPVADPLAIASVVDHVLVALTLSKSARSAASECLTRLSGNGANVLGLVVNKFGAADSYSYGGGGYGAGYSYGKTTRKNPYYAY